MQIITKQMTIKEIAASREFPDGFVKGAVDVQKRLAAIDAEMHYELSD